MSCVSRLISFAEPMAAAVGAARFKCVMLLCRDVVAAARFYEAALSLPAAALSEEFAELATGGTPITLKLAPRCVRACVRVYACGRRG